MTTRLVMPSDIFRRPMPDIFDAHVYALRMPWPRLQKAQTNLTTGNAYNSVGLTPFFFVLHPVILSLK